MFGDPGKPREKVREKGQPRVGRGAAQRPLREAVWVTAEHPPPEALSCVLCISRLCLHDTDMQAPQVPVGAPERHEARRARPYDSREPAGAPGPSRGLRGCGAGTPDSPYPAGTLLCMPPHLLPSILTKLRSPRSTPYSVQRPFPDSQHAVSPVALNAVGHSHLLLSVLLGSRHQLPLGSRLPL